MAVNVISDTQFADLFRVDATPESETTPSTFGMEETDADILSNALKVETTPTTEQVEEKVEEVEEKVNPDILTDTPKLEEKVVDFSEFYTNRVKAGKFVPIEQEDAEGKIIQFVPKTPEEFEEVLDLQVDYKLQEKVKGLNEAWYNSKSNAWKYVAQYAELVDDPTQILPFLQGVQNIQSIAAIDEKEIEGAEQIVRYDLQSKNVDNDLIEDQILSLKTKDKLIEQAQKIKPVMLQKEQQSLALQQQQQQQQMQGYYEMVNTIRDEAIKAIESPISGNIPLKKEDKAIVYDLIAEPSPETKGYGIYNLIDNLFETKDFDTLRQIALLGVKKQAFFTEYFSAGVANKTAADLQKKLRIATDSRSSTSNDFHEETTIQRKPFVKGSGFGYIK